MTDEVKNTKARSKPCREILPEGRMKDSDGGKDW
jgi:hypothetical protein